MQPKQARAPAKQDHSSQDSLGQNTPSNSGWKVRAVILTAIGVVFLALIARVAPLGRFHLLGSIGAPMDAESGDRAKSLAKFVNTTLKQSKT